MLKKLLPILILLLIYPFSGQAQTSLTGLIVEAPFASRPAACTSGDLFFATDTFVLYQCGPINTWSSIAGGGQNSAPPQGTVQEAGASAGTFAASPLVDVGGNGTIVKNSADSEFCGGPNPYIDMRCFARQVSSSSTMLAVGGVTATCTGGLATVSLSSASDFVNGDGITIYHCGANNSGTTPGAPTVTASGTALGTNTRIVKSSVAPTQGSTTYTYKVVGVTKGRGYSLPSSAATITNGEASLGTQTATISTISVTNNIATVTTSSSHTISPGYEINIAGTTNPNNGGGLDYLFGGNYSVIAVPDATHFTYQIRQDVRNGAFTSASGGTATWTNTNHISVTASGGYDYYVVYNTSLNSVACITEPVNSNLAGDQAYLSCDDYGTTLGGNFVVPEYLSATVPVSATNDSLTTTIVSGAGTTSLTLAASATVSGSNTIHYDATPGYINAANTANAIGAPVYLSITSGTNIWTNTSYVTWPSGTKILQAGTNQIADTWNVSAVNYWRGVDGAPCSKPQFGLVCAPLVNITSAYPGVYGLNVQLDKLTFSTGQTNDPSPFVLLDSVNDVQLSNLNFAGSGSASEYLSMGLEIRGNHSNGTAPFSNTFTNLSFSSGPNPNQYSVTSTPMFYCNTCGATVLDHVSTGRRGVLFRAPDFGTQATIHFYYNQGGINPAIRVGFADSGASNVILNIDNETQDTTAMPIVSSLLGAITSINILTSNGPSTTGAGGVPPPVSGVISLLNMNNSGNQIQASGSNSNICNFSVSIWDPTFNPAFTNTSEAVCSDSSQTNITPGYSIYTSDINIVAPTCSVSSAGPPFTNAGTYSFQAAAVWFNGKLGALSPKSTSCIANGTTQQITVVMPAVPTGASGWAVFANGIPVGASYPSTTTTSYVFFFTSGGGAPQVASGGPAGMQNSAAFPGAVWGNFYPDSPNNTANAMPTYSSNGQLIVSGCVPSAANSFCKWNGATWAIQALPTGSLVGTGQGNTFLTGIQDFSAVTEFRPKSGLTSALPATCSANPMDVYIATDATAGQNWYFCTATNIWTQQINSGSYILNTYSGSHTLAANEQWANFSATATATVPHALINHRWVIFNSSVANTITVAPDSGNITLNQVTAATASIAPGLGIQVACDGTNCFAWGIGSSGGGGGSGTVSSCAVNGVAYYSALTTVTCASPATAPNGVAQTIVSTPSGGLSQPPVSALPGIVGRAVSGTVATDTILSTDCNPNRVEYVGSVAVAVTLPTAVTLGVPKCVFKIVNTTSPSQTVTITPTTWTINGNSSIPLTFGQQLWVYVDPNSATNWVADATDLSGNLSGAAVPASAKLTGTNSSSQLIAAGLNNTHIYVGNASNLPVDVAVSGDASLSNTGTVTVTAVNGGTLPTSSNVVGTNGSKQIVAATAHNIVLPWECADSSGSGTVQVCNTSPTFTPVAGDTIIYTTTTANTGTGLTVNVNSLGAKSVAKWQNSTTLAPNDIRSNTEVLLSYDGTNWELSTIGNAPAGGSGQNPCTTTNLSLQYDNGGNFGCVTEFTYASSTITLSSAGKIDMTNASATAGFHLPSAAGAAPTNGGILSYDTTNNRFVGGNATNTSIFPWFTATPTASGIVGWSGTTGLQTTITALPSATTATTQSALDNSTKVATTAYTDTAVSNAIAASNPAVAVLAATTGSNLTGTYSNGASGIGATFTITATGAFTLDGVAINTIGQRVLLKDQTSGFQNGVYTATVVGTTGVSPVFTRALDYDQPSDINSTGAIPVQSGTANAATSWLLTSTVNTVGTDALTYIQFSYAPSNVVVDTGNTTTIASKVAVSTTTAGKINYIDFPDFKVVPAANCNNTTAGPGWSIGSGGTVTCRAGTNNLGGYISITDTSSTFATFQVVIPEDWDTATNPYVRFQLASTDATNAHTIIPEINVACYKGDGSTTDDVAPNGFHSLSTVTLNGNANRFWSTSNVQMNSTDVTGCVAGALMQITVGRATDTATNAEFYSATITFPRLLAVQAN